MDHDTTVHRTTLPGVGIQYDVTTGDGHHLSVVAHNDGRRFIGLYDRDDPDTCRDTIPLDVDDAQAVARLLNPTRDTSITTRAEPEPPPDLESDKTNHLTLADLSPQLVTEQLPITPKSPFSGRTLGETQARTRTGASIVAVLRRTGPIPSPGPEFRFATGDTLVVVGTREGADAVAAIIAGG